MAKQFTKGDRVVYTTKTGVRRPATVHFTPRKKFVTVIFDGLNSWTQVDIDRLEHIEEQQQTEERGHDRRNTEGAKAKSS